MPRTEQEELRESVRRFLADRAPLTRVRELMETDDGTDREVWQQAGAQLGLPGLAVPEEYGGAGFTFAEQAIVLEELGAALYGGPYLASAVLAATALLASPDEAAKQELLPGIASGETVATLAFTEDDGSWDPAAIRLAAAKDGRRLAAGRAQELRPRRARRRPDPGRRRDQTAGLSLFAVAGGRRRADPDRSLPTLDQTRKLARLEFAAVPARLIGAPGDAGAVLDRTLDVAAIALAAEQLGGAQRALDMAVDYAKIRHQFGRPIGSFQAIKHRCADLLLEVESLRSAVSYAAAAVAEDSAEVPVARRRWSRRTRRRRTSTSPRRTSRSTAASASPGSTTPTCTSSGPSPASCSSATPPTTASGWPRASACRRRETYTALRANRVRVSTVLYHPKSVEVGEEAAGRLAGGARVPEGVVAVLPHDPRLRPGGEEAGRAVEVGHLQVGGADAGCVVRVGARAAGPGEALRQPGRLLVVRLVGGLGVEHLDDVRLPGGAEGAEGSARCAEAGADRIERVRHVDQRTLRPDPAR